MKLEKEKQLEYALLLMVYQYCVDDNGDMYDECMSAGENAFGVLGIENGTPSIDVWTRIENLEAENDNH